VKGREPLRYARLFGDGVGVVQLKKLSSLFRVGKRGGGKEEKKAKRQGAEAAQQTIRSADVGAHAALRKSPKRLERGKKTTNEKGRGELGGGAGGPFQDGVCIGTNSSKTFSP